MPKLDVSLDDQGDVAILRLAGTLDGDTAPQLAPTIDELVAQKRQRVVVDLDGLEQIDSPGVAALVGCTSASAPRAASSR